VGDLHGDRSPGATGAPKAGGSMKLGQIVGEFIDASGQHGFLLDQGSFNTIDVPGATATLPTQSIIAARSWAFYVDVSGTTHGFLLDEGIFATIDVPGAR